MIRYFETTALVLLWCGFLSWAWTRLCYEVVIRRAPGAGRLAADRSGIILPALVAAPLLVVLAFRLAGINLLYPVVLFASPLDLVKAALAPALILMLASGLAGTLLRLVTIEYRHYRAQPFSRVALAMGKSPERTLRPLILTKALATAWSRCMPWLFGDLIIVESIFNAPGLGLDAWQSAKSRDPAGLLSALVWLMAIYGLSAWAAARFSAKLGRRLASYA